MCFSTNFRRHFFKSNNVGGRFCPDFHGFDQIFWDFVEIFMDLARIVDQPNFLGVHLQLRLLHHCVAGKGKIVLNCSIALSSRLLQVTICFDFREEHDA